MPVEVPLYVRLLSRALHIFAHGGFQFVEIVEAVAVAAEGKKSLHAALLQQKIENVGNVVLLRILSCEREQRKKFLRPRPAELLSGCERAERLVQRAAFSSA